VADPETGFNIVVDGQAMVVGGTSGSAPLLAGLIARLNQALGRRLGFFNPALYSMTIGVQTVDITQGNNGLYVARPGFDCCTGNGRPIGSAMLAFLQGSPPVTPPPVVVVPPVAPPVTPPIIPPPAIVYEISLPAGCPANAKEIVSPAGAYPIDVPNTIPKGKYTLTAN
jgi:hypothetical protein